MSIQYLPTLSKFGRLENYVEMLISEIVSSFWKRASRVTSHAAIFQVNGFVEQVSFYAIFYVYLCHINIRLRHIAAWIIAGSDAIAFISIHPIFRYEFCPRTRNSVSKNLDIYKNLVVNGIFSHLLHYYISKWIQIA